MNIINVETKTNGYEAKGIQEMICRFEKVAADLFPGCTVSHFYYGDYLDMAAIRIGEGDHAYFNIYKSRVSLCGYAGKSEDVRKWESMTHNDELYDGKLIELAGF